MALLPCKECGTEVADSALTCPKCGVNRPGTAAGMLAIIRFSKMTGAMHAVQVAVDGELAGEVMNGGTFFVELTAGQHTVQVNGGGMSRDASINIGDGEETRYQMYFSNWGFLGGGLNFKPA